MNDEHGDITVTVLVSIVLIAILGFCGLVGGWHGVWIGICVLVILVIASLLIYGFFALCGRLFGGLF